VAWNDPVLVKPLLDMGPTGIIFPMINTAGDLKQAIAACRYPPEGIRGFSPRAALRYGLDDVQEYIHEKSPKVWVICQIETMQAYKNLDELLACEGVDAFIIGPADFSGQFGKLAKLTDPEVDAAINEIVKKVQAAGKPVGISVGAFDYDSMKHWLSKGLNMISCGGDAAFLLKGSLQAMENMKRALL
jgi:2-dehydro-3-deoxyglucarate aldolase/4-hydroxy-2-oxoheptanedioate aldolase